MSRRTITAVVLPILFAGCMESMKPEPLHREASLYTRIGGEHTINRIANAAVANLILDDRVPEAQKRKLLDLEQSNQIQHQFAEYLSQLSGGPKKLNDRLIDVAARLGMDGELVKEALNKAMHTSNLTEDARTEFVATMQTN